jgi:hypothetical protein
MSDARAYIFLQQRLDLRWCAQLYTQGTLKVETNPCKSVLLALDRLLSGSRDGQKVLRAPELEAALFDKLFTKSKELWSEEVAFRALIDNEPYLLSIRMVP